MHEAEKDLHETEFIRDVHELPFCFIYTSLHEIYTTTPFCFISTSLHEIYTNSSFRQIYTSFSKLGEGRDILHGFSTSFYNWKLTSVHVNTRVFSTGL